MSGKGAGEIGEFADLRMKQPGVEAQVQRRETGKSLAEGAVEQQALRPRGVHAGDLRIGIPGGRMPDAAEAAVAGGNFRFQHRLAPSPSSRLTWLTMPAQIAALP